MSEELNPTSRDLARQMGEVIVREIRANPAFGTPWMGTEQAAAYLKMSCAGMVTHRRNGTGPKHYMPAGLIRYHRDDLDAWLFAAPKGAGK